MPLFRESRPRRSAPGLSPPEPELEGLPKILASAGGLSVRLARTSREIGLAQKLRYRVFFEEGAAMADPRSRRSRRDICRFDEVCDHLIVVDDVRTPPDSPPAVVGAYRLLRQEIAQAHFGFYSQSEFQVDSLLERHPEKRFMELGRSCIASGYRGRRALELLWRGIWRYALRHGVEVMFGCASFPGLDAGAHAATLLFLRGEAEPEPSWTVEAVAGAAAVGFQRDGTAHPQRDFVRALPPLIKGYWRLGAKFSPEAVVDRRFGTTDVFVVLPIENIGSRYLTHFAPECESPQLAA